MAFNAVNKAPGVYIDEIQLPGPIAGVSTSTAAFVGPAEMGPIYLPTRLTNPTQFTNVFGGYITDPMVYVTHAVHAFFANGGTLCYFVRTGTGKRSHLDIVDKKGRPTLVVTAKQEGTAGDAITASLEQVSLVSDVKAVRLKTTLFSAKGREAMVPDNEVTPANAQAKIALADAEAALEAARKVVPPVPADITAKEGAVTTAANAVKTLAAAVLADLAKARGDLATAQTALDTARKANPPVPADIKSAEDVVKTADDKVKALTAALPTATARAELATATTALKQAETTLDTARKANPPVPANIKSAEDAVKAADDTVRALTAALQAAATAHFGGFFANWRPGDVVLIKNPNDDTKSDRATIERVRFDAASARTVVVFREPLKFTYPEADPSANPVVRASTIRIADLNPGDTRIRLEKVTDIEAGSFIEISQGVDDPATPEDDVTREGAVVKSVDRVNKAVTLEGKLQNLFDMRKKDDANADVPPVLVRTMEFTLTIRTPGVEVYRDMSIDPRHSRYFEQIVKSDFVDVTLADPPSNSRPPDNRPFGLATQSPPTGTFANEPLAKGVDEDITGLDQTHYSEAINSLERIDEVNILSIPDSAAFKKADGTPDLDTVRSVQFDMISHCEKMQDRFAVLDPLPEDRGATAPNRILGQREILSSDRGFAALYYPWIYIKNPVAKGRILVPPSGHIAGLYARVDDQRGVHKAPANEAPRGILGLELSLGDSDQGPLNEAGINVIRFFPGRGIRVWGARTIAPKDITQWRYVNVRRLVLYIEESIQEATQFAVFEPNELGLWKKLSRQVTSFLTGVWRDGALFGATAEDAFRVRVDEELNPPNKVALGILTVEVIVRPTSPAEFVVFRVIADPTGDALIQE